MTKRPEYRLKVPKKKNAKNRKQGKTQKKIPKMNSVHESTSSHKRRRGRSETKRVSKLKRNPKGACRKALLRDAGITLAIILLIVGLSARFIFSIHSHEGYAMTTVLNDKDVVFVNRLGTVRRYTLVLFREPRKNEVTIRRVIGLPGEQIRYEGDTLYVNDEAKTEYFLAAAKQEAKKSGYLLTEDFTVKDILTENESAIPEGKYLVLGDNRPYATDSRYYGLIEQEQIIGTISMRILPLHKLQQF